MAEGAGRTLNPLPMEKGCKCSPAALAKSGGSKGKEAPNEGPPPKGVDTLGCLARARGEAP